MMAGEGLVAPMLVAAVMAQGVGEMRGERRVLIVAAASAADPLLTAQRKALAGWRAGAAARDVTVVEVIGDRVAGASDTAAALRRTYRLPPDRFAVALVGKDGHVAYRTTDPVTADRLQGTIDAMPMRRAGGR